MGGDQKNFTMHSRGDRGREVFGYGAGGSNVFVSVRGNHRSGPPPSYRGRNDASHYSRNGGRGASSRLPDQGHWRGRGRGSYYSSRGGEASIGRRPLTRYDDLLQPDSKPDRAKTRQDQYMRGRGGRGGRDQRYRLDRRITPQNNAADSTGWQKVIIYDAAHHEPSKVMEEVDSMVGEKFEHHMLATEANNITFYMEDNKSVGKSLQDLSKRLAMPGSNHRYTISVSHCRTPPFRPATEQDLETVKMLMAQRYSGYLKRLDLSMFHKDSRLVESRLLYPLYVPSNMASVGRLITANVAEVEEIDLSSNKLMRIDSMVEHLKACPNLSKLNLNRNKFITLKGLQKLQGLAITEMSLEGNPLCQRYKNIETYISEIRSIFPKLLVLDGKELPKPIGFEVDDSDGVVPTFEASFFCNEQAKQIVLLFLKQFYQVFDSDERSGLQAAYCEDAIFSVSTLLPENGPRAVLIDNDLIPNRNLRVCHETDDRVELLFTGRDKIMSKIINNLPPCTHDLDSFIVDVPIAKPLLIKVIVNGVYRRKHIKSKNANTRSFQRSLVIVPVGDGFCIANEQLYITLATYDQIKNSFKNEGTASATTATPTAVAATSTAAAGSTDNSGGLEPLQQQMIEQFALKSNMIPHYAKLCLEQNAWNFDKAADMFINLKNEGKIPQEYFKI